jgi:hypothetical protein
MGSLFFHHEDMKEYIYKEIGAIEPQTIGHEQRREGRSIEICIKACATELPESCEC